MDILITSKALFRPSQDDPLYRLVVKSLEKWLAISNMKVCDPKWKVKVWVWHLRRRKAWGCCRSLCTCDTFDQTLMWIKFMFIVHFVFSDGNDILLKMLHFLDCLFPHVEADPSMIGLPPYENKNVLSPHIGIVFKSQFWQINDLKIGSCKMWPSNLTSTFQKFAQQYHTFDHISWCGTWRRPWLSPGST